MSSRIGTERPSAIGRARDRVPAEPARRIAAASLVIVVLLAGMLGVTLWRYESAIGRYQGDALEARLDAEDVKQASAAFWQEQSAIFRYVQQQSPAVLGQLESARRNFADNLSRLHIQSTEESDLRARALAANRNSIENFVDNVRPALSGASGQSLVIALNEQQRFGNSVIPPLNQLADVESSQADSAVSAAKGSGREALIAGLVAALLSLLGAVGFTIYAIRLIGEVADRERRLNTAVGDLSEREGNLKELLEHVRSTSGVLSEVVIDCARPPRKPFRPRASSRRRSPRARPRSSSWPQPRRRCPRTCAASPRSPSAPGTRCRTCGRRSRRSPSGR